MIKLADRLHNMRSVHVLSEDKQLSVADETLEVWCSIADSLGWSALKSEMEVGRDWVGSMRVCERLGGCPTSNERWRRGVAVCTSCVWEHVDSPTSKE